MTDWLSSMLEYVLDFSNVLNASISASWLILVVVVLRLLLKKTPKWVAVMLWGIVAIRLLFPFSIESVFSLIPSAETISEELLQAGPVPGVQPAYLEIVTNPSYGREVTMELDRSIGSFQWDLLSMTFVWLAGVAIMVIYTAVSYWRLRRKVSTAVILRDNIFQSENVVSPFVLGIIKPKVYLPYHMDGQDLGHVVALEQAHIRRKDHWWKPLGFLLLTIYWFNPLMWLAYVLLCRDIELACDEKVIKELGNEQRADYTQALVACSVGRRMIAACPLAFGEVGVKERVKSVMNYKKPAFWVILLAVIVCVVVAVCFLTDPVGFQFDEETHTIVSANHFDMRNGDDAVAIEMNPAQISELSSRLVGVRNTKKSDEYGGFTPGYQISALLEDGTYIRISGYSLSENDMVDIEWDGERYVVSDTDFQDYMSRICAGEDVAVAPDESAPDKVAFEAEILEIHEGYFLVAPEASWALNSADRIEVPMMNMDPALEPQVGDVIEIICSGEILETYPARLSKVYSIRVAEETSRLSLNDVIILSQYGYDLSWSDFENYEYIETGSGLYIRVYEINEMYELWIGGAGPDSNPMYIYLALADDLDTRIDIRDGGVTEFIGADHSEVLLTNAIYDAILEHNKPSKPDGLYHSASFVLLDQKELCIDSDPPTPMQVIVYGMALHQAFSFTDAGLQDAQGSHIPVMLTFEKENDAYTLLEYWQPRDGSYYAQDIREKFPDEVEDDALDTQKYIVSQMQNCYDQAVRYGGVDTDTVIGHLLKVIASSPAQSSNPGDYIDEHSIEYRELTYYGQYTLRYCFDQFLKGGQNDLVGHIMALACQDIMLGWGEAYAMDQVLMTGQEWFEEFRSIAGSLVSQYSSEELKTLYPGAWLLLQMQPLCGYPLATEQEVLAEIIKIDPSKIITEPTDGFGANVPNEWVERDSEMLIPGPKEDIDPNFSMPADGSMKNNTRLQIVPAQ